MMPPYTQFSLQLLFSASLGGPPSETVGEPGTQGAGVTGTHADGAPGPAITAGFVGAVHIPRA